MRWLAATATSDNGAFLTGLAAVLGVLGLISRYVLRPVYRLVRLLEEVGHPFRPDPVTGRTQYETNQADILRRLDVIEQSGVSIGEIRLRVEALTARGDMQDFLLQQASNTQQKNAAELITQGHALVRIEGRQEDFQARLVAVERTSQTTFDYLAGRSPLERRDAPRPTDGV